MKGIGGGYGDPQGLCQLVGVRSEQRGRTEKADFIAFSLQQSSNLLRDAGISAAARIHDPHSNARPVGTGGGDVFDNVDVNKDGQISRQELVKYLEVPAAPRSMAAFRSMSPMSPRSREASPTGRPGAANRSASRGAAAAAAAPAPVARGAGAVVAAASARDLFDAILDSGGDVEDHFGSLGFMEPRMISVRDFQRGKAVVAPAPVLPFGGSESMSPGERRRAAALATAVRGREGRPLSTRARLADGVHTLLPAVHLDLGELVLQPAAPCSNFMSLLDKLVDAPEACFARPLSVSAAGRQTAARAGSPASSPRGRGGGGGRGR